LLLTPLEDAIFDVDWKVRYSSVTLLGTVIEILLKCGTMPDEKMQEEVMSFERRSYVLSLLYMIRSDEHSVVRQQAAFVWKSVVQDNAKTLKEVIPILLRRVVNYLQSPHPTKQK
jgi:HEAT repeat protein